MKDDGNIHDVQSMPVDHWGNWSVPGTPYRVRERCYEWRGTKFVSLDVEGFGKPQVKAGNALRQKFNKREVNAELMREVGAWLVDWWRKETRQ